MPAHLRCSCRPRRPVLQQWHADHAPDQTRASSSSCCCRVRWGADRVVHCSNRALRLPTLQCQLSLQAAAHPSSTQHSNEQRGRTGTAAAGRAWRLPEAAPKSRAAAQGTRQCWCLADCCCCCRRHRCRWLCSTAQMGCLAAATAQAALTCRQRQFKQSARIPCSTHSTLAPSATGGAPQQAAV